MLAGATVRAVDGTTLVLSHESEPLARRLSEQRNADVIAEALKDALGVNWRVRCEFGPPATGPAAETGAATEAAGGAHVDAHAAPPAAAAGPRAEEHTIHRAAGR